MNINIELEEFGPKKALCLEVNIEGGHSYDDFYDDSFEIYEVRCVSIWGENWYWEDNQRPDWFELLNQIVTNYVHQHEDEIMQLCAVSVQRGWFND